MFDSLPTPLLALAFALAAGAVWKAGLPLARATDALSRRFGLGEALGGVIVLAFATNLPEIAITASAASSGRLEVAVGNLLGGVAAQTVVLALLDAAGGRAASPLTRRAASLGLVLEAVLVMTVLGAVVLGAQLSPSVVILRTTPGALAIVAFWIAGVFLVSRAREGLPWRRTDDAPDEKTPQPKKGEEKPLGAGRAGLVFAAGAAATLVGGVVLERAGDAAAARLGMGGALFGATVLAAATSLPEVATGLASIRMGEDTLAVSDIFGGNAFLPTLFLLATLVSGRAVLPRAHPTDLYLTALGILLTAVYVVGLIFRPRRRILRMGADSFAVVVLYALGIAGLILVSAR